MIKTGLGTFYLHIENNMVNARDLRKVLSEAITSTLESSFQEVDGLKPHQEEAVFNVIALDYHSSGIGGKLSDLELVNIAF